MNSLPPVPASVVPGILSPAIPSPAGASLLALQYQLEHTQWWTPGQLLEQQCRQLGALFEHARQFTDFYPERLAGAGYRPGEAVTPALLGRIPVLTRSELQAAGAAVASRRTPPEHGRVAPVRTSGSTGRPVQLGSTELCGLFWGAFTLRDHLWHRRDLGGKLAIIRHLADGQAMGPEGRMQPAWGAASAAAYATGPGAVLNSATPVSVQAEWLQRQDPEYLLTHPSNLAALARHALAQGWRLSRLRELRTVGEVVEEPLRELCGRAFGLGLTDMYSAQEVGYIALQCPEQNRYHVQAEGLLVEILDAAGHPAAPGDWGQVVITDLHNFATPLIRYAVGDCARPGAPCPCGRGLPVIEAILGRVRNMLVTADGERRWPDLGSKHYPAIADIRQFRFLQRSRRRIDVELVVGAPLTAEQEQALRALWARSLGEDFEFRIRYRERIPPGSGGKFEDFVSEPAAEDA